MKKVIVISISIMLAFGMLAGCAGTGATTESQAATTTEAAKTTEAAATTTEAAKSPVEGMKIAYFVSDMRETFHQAQFAAGQAYGLEEYGLEVIAFDGKGDPSTQTSNIDQITAQGMNAATLHIWDNDAAKPGIQDCIDNGIAMASFFSPVPGSGIPVVRNDEAGVSTSMGTEMAQQWKAANPDKPIVMVQLGWPNHVEVKSGRTDPFVAAVKAVDATATDLGCLEANNEDDAKRIIKDVVQQHPEVNLIYAESGGIARGVLAGLTESGRGTVGEDGKPTTELICTCDFDEVQMGQIYDANSSLKFSMALPPIDTGKTRIDVLVQLLTKEIEQKEDVEKEYIAKADLISYYSVDKADVEAWLAEQFGG